MQIDEALARVGGLPGELQPKAVDMTDGVDFAKRIESLHAFGIFIPNLGALSGDRKESLQTDIQATVDATAAAVPIPLRSSHAAITCIGCKAGSLPAWRQHHRAPARPPWHTT